MELTDKVLIDSLCNWPLYFKRANGMGDISIPANAKGFSQLDVAEVQMQIQLGNRLFIGTDPASPGDHARLFIKNEEQRKQLLGYPVETSKDVVAVTPETVKSLLSIRGKKEFNERLNALVKTDAEKKMVVQIAKDAGGDDMPAWKMDAIKEIAGTVTI